MGVELSGPFSVDPAQIEALPPREFTEFINRLLNAEIAAQGLSGHMLSTTLRIDDPDGGVDARLYGAEPTTWVPSGDSAWQFKSGKRGPAECSDELASAEFALETLLAGGNYCLAFGVDYTDALVKARCNALVKKATDLGVADATSKITVLNASSLARWAESYPALAVSPLLSRIGKAGVTLDDWTRSNAHSSVFVESEGRSLAANEILTAIRQGELLDIRIEGESGLGKTRLVMEALRDQPEAPLVVYFDDATDLGTVIDHLLRQNRTAVVVVDQCSSLKHKTLAARLPASDCRVRLITVGEPDEDRGISVIRLAPMDEAGMEALLEQNESGLWVEARRVVLEVANGNVRLALVLARAVVKQPRTSASELLTEDMIRTYITQAIPDGTSFLACSALALFSRIGYDRELCVELRLLADVLDISVADIRAAAVALNKAGLLTKQGRYRSVSPHPVAVYLATEGWREFADVIVRELLPQIDSELADRLFRRASDVGSFGPTRDAVARLLREDPSFASFEAIAEEDRSRLLVQFAIVAPEEVAQYLGGLIDAASDEELGSQSSVRRSLVRTLGKLAWHRSTFESAARMLVRLAATENEAWSNNSTGTWTSLFGVMLPATASLPEERIALLRDVAASTDQRIRRLTAQAAAKALSNYETIMIRAELQGGVIVEPRGRPSTWGEAWEYIEAMMDLLRQLVDDEDPSIRELATKALVSAIHPFLENDRLRDYLAAVVCSLPSEGLRAARTEIEHLQALFSRVIVVDTRPEGLRKFTAVLPEPAPIDRLRVLAFTRRGDMEDGELLARLREVMGELSPAELSAAGDELLASEVPAAFEFGHVLATLSPSEAWLCTLVGAAAGPNMPALTGYLYGLRDAGDDDIFDSTLDGLAAGLPAATLLAVTVRGPQSDRAWTRASRLLRELPVRTGAPILVGWHVSLSPDKLGELLALWIDRVDDELDYMALVNFVAMALDSQPPWIAEVDPTVARIVSLRANFPRLGQKSWDWSQLALRQLGHDPSQFLNELLDLIEADSVHAFDGTEEGSLLHAAVTAVGAGAWARVMERIEAGSWRLQMDVRDWLSDSTTPAEVEAWIDAGSELERARLVARTTSAAGATPSLVTKFLLERFGTDDAVSGALASTFVTGIWSGPESIRIQGQIDQLNGWLEGPSGGVRAWVVRMTASLEAQRSLAIEREAEMGY